MFFESVWTFTSLRLFCFPSRITFALLSISLIAREHQQMFLRTWSFVWESLRMGFIFDDFFKMLETLAPIGPRMPDSFKT